MPTASNAPAPFYIRTVAPTSGPVGALWADTSQSPPELMICTAVAPVTWADEDGAGGGGTPGGSNTQVQFNDSSAFGGDAGLTYNKTTNVLTVSDAVITSQLEASSYLKIGGIVPIFGWKPASYIGSYSSGTTYAFGEAVRASDSGTWKIYVSLIAGNANHNPVGDGDVHWFDTVNAGFSIVLQGSVDPNTTQEQNGIFVYALAGATGGTFDLGLATGIAFNATAATIKTALLAQYVGSCTVTGNANDASFTVECLFDPNDGLLLVSHLTGGGSPTRTVTQAQVDGGFKAPTSSVYLDSSSHTIWHRSSSSVWGTEYSSTLNTGKNVTALGYRDFTRDGGGDGDVDLSTFADREGAGAGSANIESDATRGGSGAGNASSIHEVTVADTAVGNANSIFKARITGSATGTATAQLLASHHASSTLTMGATADAAGVHAVIDGAIPTADPHVSGELFTVTGAGLAAALAGGAVYLLKSTG